MISDNGGIFEVSQVNEYIKSLLDGQKILSDIFVRGELSNYKVYPSGHHYFTLKDSESTIRCVMFRGSASKLVFRPENGMRVVVCGRVTVFVRDGAYQIYCEKMIPDGVGELHIAFQQLKEKLGREGLFDPAHKKPLPAFPGRIAVITSGAGAAVRDIIRILTTRYPPAKVIIMPVRVQGDEAPPEIVGAIRYANRYKIADVIITGRGGGSIEDLWAFNDERVARAIYASEIPVISAVGHEPDVTISDFVADVRASTPSNAAEIAVPDSGELKNMLDSYRSRMYGALRHSVGMRRERLEKLKTQRVMTSPQNYIDDRRVLLDNTLDRLIKTAQGVTGRDRTRFAALTASLDAMSPLKVLARGYSIAVAPDGTVIKSARDVNGGDRLTVRTADGNIMCEVEGTAIYEE